MTRIVCISDTHNRRPEVPDGDIFLHCGDMTSMGKPDELARARDWIAAMPHKHKVVIAGNHDLGIEEMGKDAAVRYWNEASIFYLQDDDIYLDGLRVWGAPWILPIWGAFELNEEDIRDKWFAIPSDTDIVMTHMPAYGRLDRIARGGIGVGCYDLRERLDYVRPALHVHGHIHEAAGVATTEWGTAINAAYCGFPDHNAYNAIQYIDI